MAVPVVIVTPSGPVEADRAAVAWLWEELDAKALPATHEALRRGLDGENLELPDDELERFGRALQGILARLDPASPHASALAELASKLAGR
jgi:hypothetical protein